jgi:signal transduction histidine kinase
LINYLILRNLWTPFYKAVTGAENFDILTATPLELPETDILEFQQLNRVIKNMTQKMRSDYLNLKEYNENASHEIQTPLAIIRSKTELLMQNKNLTKDSLNLIRSINDATSKLFKLNQGLLLISKIENQYFSESIEVSLSAVIESCLDNYREIADLKAIRVTLQASDQAIVRINAALADILISNLISNAVRYNIDKGFITCKITNQTISISNSGLPLLTDPELFFKRFHKGGNNPDSVGLGLSIVKRIADNYNMQIKYSCNGNVHEMLLTYR